MRQAAIDFHSNVFKYTSKSTTGNLGSVLNDVDAKIEEECTTKAYSFEVCVVAFCDEQMMGLDDVEWRNRVQDAIIGIKGVVSITFDHNRNMVVVFIRDTKDKMRYNLVKQAIA